MIVIVVALTLGLAGAAQQGSPAQDQEPSPSAETPTRLPPATVNGQSNEEDPNRQICRRQAATIGSNRPRRICAPAWQWEQAREETREMLRRNPYGPGSSGPTTGGDAPPGRGF